MRGERISSGEATKRRAELAPGLGPAWAPLGERRSDVPGEHRAGASDHRFSDLPLFPRLPAGAQPKLIVGQPAERCEVEADRIADRVAGRVSGLAGGGALGTTATGLLPASVRAPFEGAFGRSFSSVRIHADGGAARTAEAASAHAFTVGSDIYFGPGKFAPGSAGGQRLLAHELTHVAQQGGAPPLAGSAALPVAERAPVGVLGSFFGDLWEGVKSVGSAIGQAVSTVFDVVGSAVGGILRDATMFVGNLIRDLPGRLARLAETLVQGLVGVVTFIPEMIRALAGGGLRGLGAFLWERIKAGGAYLLTLLSRAFDLVGGPEAAELIMHLVSFGSSPLTPDEINAAKGVLGDHAVRWEEVRVGEGGLLALIFKINKDRAFTTWHTINISTAERANRAIMVHELTHVYQYEKVGTLYLGQAIHAQATIGYGYGEAAGLQNRRAAGAHFRDFNREQQAQIAQDYYTLTTTGGDVSAYEPFIAELRAGEL